MTSMSNIYFRKSNHYRLTFETCRFSCSLLCCHCRIPSSCKSPSSWGNSFVEKFQLLRTDSPLRRLQILPAVAWFFAGSPRGFKMKITLHLIMMIVSCCWALSEIISLLAEWAAYDLKLYYMCTGWHFWKMDFMSTSPPCLDPLGVILTLLMVQNSWVFCCRKSCK